MDSKRLDIQAAHETTLSATLTALAGANVIYGLGMLDMGITLDFTKLVVDNEFAYMIKRAVAGIEVNADTIAFDTISQVGAGGEFVSHEHTFLNFKNTQSSSNLIDRRNADDWVRLGSHDMWEKANEVAKDLYDNYDPNPLSESVKKEIRGYVNEAEEHYGVKISEE